MWIGIRMRNRKRPYHTSYSLTCKINMRVLHFITLVTILNSSSSYDRPQKPQLIDTLCCRGPLFFPPQRTRSRRTSRAFQQNSHTRLSSAEFGAAFGCFRFRGFSPPAVASSRRRVSLMLMRQAGGRPAGSDAKWRNVRRNAA
jgi:hypothetical protein